MKDRSYLFGSYGIRSVQAMFGQRNKRTRKAPTEVPAPVFGKRTQQPDQSISLREARLSYLHCELKVLFEDEAFPGEVLPFALDLDRETPRLLIGDRAVVTIDSETGHLVFTVDAAHAGVIIVTANEERLIDHVVCHLAASGKASAAETANKAAQILVGETLADVERRVILQTLRHCHGNRTHAADMLGISLRTIRNKLRTYWRTTEQEGEQV